MNTREDKIFAKGKTTKFSILTHFISEPQYVKLGFEDSIVTKLVNKKRSKVSNATQDVSSDEETTLVGKKRVKTEGQIDSFKSEDDEMVSLRANKRQKKGKHYEEESLDSIIATRER